MSSSYSPQVARRYFGVRKSGQFLRLEKREVSRPPVWNCRPLWNVTNIDETATGLRIARPKILAVWSEKLKPIFCHPIVSTGMIELVKSRQDVLYDFFDGRRILKKEEG